MDASSQAPRTLSAWKAYVGCSLLFLVVFLGIYPACNSLTTHRETLWTLHLPWERNIPFVPGFIGVYLSLFLLWPLQPFLLGPREIGTVTRGLLLACAVAGVCFLLLPARLGFDRQLPDNPLLAALFQLLYRLDAPHNLVPSLHVTNSGLVLMAFIDKTPRPWLRGLWILWLLLIVASTLLTHQHHVLDAITGLGLALVIHRGLRSLRRAGQPQQPLAKGSQDSAG